MGGFGTPKLQIDGAFATVTKAGDARFIYTPGNESPAVSTSDYYHTHACQYMHPYDLDSMGPAGAAAKTALGGRYVWIFCTDHPGGGGGMWRDSGGFKLGVSNDPGVFPATALDIIPMNNSFVGGPSIPGSTNGGLPYTLFSDFAPSALVYNPDDVTFPFYLYTQGSPGSSAGTSLGTQSIMWMSGNLLNWVPGAMTPKNIDMLPGGLTSHQWVERIGTGSWITYGTVGQIGRIGIGSWIGTNGKDFTYPSSVWNVSGFPSVNLTLTGTTITASSAIFNSSHIGQAVQLNTLSGSNWLSLMGGNPQLSVLITAIGGGGTTATLSANQPGDLPLAAYPFEIGPVIRMDGPANTLGGRSFYSPTGQVFLVGSQLYTVLSEDARHAFQPTDDGQYINLVPVGADHGVSQVLPTIRLAHYAGIYTGQRYVQGVTGYYEDGISHIYAQLGYPGPHATHPAPHVGARTTGSLAGNILTLTSVAGFVSPGALITMSGPGAQGAVGTITSFGLGSGGVGTYNITNSKNINSAPGSQVFWDTGSGIGSFSGTVFSVTSITSPGSPITVGQRVYFSGRVGHIISVGGGVGPYTIENLEGMSFDSSPVGINGGTDYNTESVIEAGGFRQQFIEYHTVATDSTVASRAAPFGVKASCVNNVVTISWFTTPLGSGAEPQGINIYRGASPGIVVTTPLPGNPYTGTSATDSPTPGEVWYYKVVKVSDGVERTTKFRMVHTYVG